MVLIGYGLSLEGVARADQGGPPWEVQGKDGKDGKDVLRLDLKRRLESSSDEGTRTSLGSSAYSSGLPMQEVLLQSLIIGLISCMPHSTEKNKCRYLCDKGCELHSGWKVVSQETCDTQREEAVWESKEAKCALTNPLLVPIAVLCG